MIDNYVDTYIHNKKQSALNRHFAFDEKRKQFVNDYPKEKILSLSLEEYISKNESFDNNTFCERLLNLVGDYPRFSTITNDIFGIYLNKKSRIRLNDNLFKTFNTNYLVAFKHLKKEIIKVISCIDEFPNRIEMDESFLLILRYIYHPDSSFPFLFVRNADEILSFISDSEMIIGAPIKQKIEYLSKYKVSLNNNDLLNNYIFIDYCLYSIEREHQKQIDKLSSEFDQLAVEMDENKVYGDERDTIVKSRVNHSYFKKMLLKKYNECCMCKLKTPTLLIASHIKPWCVSTKEEKVDLENGFLLCALHDKLFDRGLITIDDEGKVIISKEVNSDDFDIISSTINKTLVLSDRNKEYLLNHRENIFLNGK